MQLVPYLHSLLERMLLNTSETVCCCLPEPEECRSGKLTLRSIMDAKVRDGVCVCTSFVYTCGSCPNGLIWNGISPKEKTMIYIYIDVRAHTHSHTHTDIYIYTHTHIYIHTHTHAYTHTYGIPRLESHHSVKGHSI